MTCRLCCCIHEAVASLVPRWCATEEETLARGLLGGATLLLVEDMEGPRRALRRYFGDALRLVEATNVTEGIAHGRMALPDLSVVMTDLGLPDGSGWQVVAALHSFDPTLRFLVISGIQDTGPPEDLPAAVIDRTFVVDKPTSGDELLAAAAYAHHLVRQERGAGEGTGVSVGSRLEPRFARRPDHPALSHRESQAMRGCMLGLTNEQIAEQLGIAFGTARKHVSAGLRKLHVTSRREVKAAIDRDRRSKGE
jgi:DNA-binding NarL/FixJ family response regulator